MTSLPELVLPLAVLLGASNAVANTFFKCVDAKGAITVQQAACASSSSQEEKRVSASHVHPTRMSTPATGSNPASTSNEKAPRR